MRALTLLLVPGALALDPGPFQPLTMPRPEAPGEPWEVTERADGLLVRGRGLRVLLDAGRGRPRRVPRGQRAAGAPPSAPRGLRGAR